MDFSWISNDRWNDPEKKFFFEKLGRLRKVENRAVALDTKAGLLFDTKKPEKVKAAIELLTFRIHHFTFSYRMSLAYVLLGNCLDFQGNAPEALAAFEKAIEWDEKEGVTGQSTLQVEIILRKHAESRYPEALAILKEYIQRASFPYEKFRFFAFLALLNRQMGENELAEKEARRALPFLQGDVGLRGYPGLCGVNKDSWVYREFNKNFSHLF